MKKNYWALLLVTCTGAHAQTESVPFTSDRWNKEGAKMVLENYMGKECALITSGTIFIKDLALQDGTIEVDMNFPNVRSFPGIHFRRQDSANTEHFYVRPHQSGNPDAVQYTPVFNNSDGWQLYHGSGYSAVKKFNFNQWHHVKIEIHGRQAEIYMDDLEKPLVKVTELKRDSKAGTIGLGAARVDARFANLQYTIKTPETPPALIIPANGTDGLITKYEVSQQVPGKWFEELMQLTPAFKSKFKFMTQPSEPSGTINLGKFTVSKDTGNTMVAKLVIESATDQLKAISFGFSDYVILYLNDKALYVGRDAFMSRDYRYLGTIGFFDTVILPLKKGRNECWFVVSEDFGGWGVKAKLGDMKGISLP